MTSSLKIFAVSFIKALAHKNNQVLHNNMLVGEAE